MALFSVTAVLAVVAIIGTTSYMMTKTDMAICANQLRKAKAMAYAEAGVNYARSRIEAAIASSAFPYMSNGGSCAVSYAAPAGYTFDTITNVSRTAAGSYFYTVQGREGFGFSSISTVWSRKRLLRYGVFGEIVLELKASGITTSYESAALPVGVDPAVSDSTHVADVATDGTLITHNGASVDGSLVLGATVTGINATWAMSGTPIVSGVSGLNVGYIDPDPLGVMGGPLAATFTAVAAANDNARAIPPIVGNVVNVGNGDVLTLPSGNYYLTDLRLNNGSILQIAATNGPVNIYLNGGATFVNSSAINGARPTDFAIYSRSSQSITVGNTGAFRGLIYAPNAAIDMKNGGDVYGVIWGRQAVIRNSANMFVDESLQDRFQGSKLTLLSWKENRDS